MFFFFVLFSGTAGASASSVLVLPVEVPSTHPCLLAGQGDIGFYCCCRCWQINFSDIQVMDLGCVIPGLSYCKVSSSQLACTEEWWLGPLTRRGFPFPDLLAGETRLFLFVLYCACWWLSAASLYGTQSRGLWGIK